MLNSHAAVIAHRVPDTDAPLTDLKVGNRAIVSAVLTFGSPRMVQVVNASAVPSASSSAATTLIAARAPDHHKASPLACPPALADAAATLFFNTTRAPSPDSVLIRTLEPSTRPQRAAVKRGRCFFGRSEDEEKPPPPARAAPRGLADEAPTAPTAPTAPHEGLWTSEEDDVLLAAVASRGESAWAVIARELLPGRSRHACRNRFRLLHGFTRQGKKRPSRARVVHLAAAPSAGLDEAAEAAAAVLVGLRAAGEGVARLVVAAAATNSAGDQWGRAESALDEEDAAPMMMLIASVAGAQEIVGALDAAVLERGNGDAEDGEPFAKRLCCEH